MSTTSERLRPSTVLAELRSEMRQTPTIFVAFAWAGVGLLFWLNVTEVGIGVPPGAFLRGGAATLISLAVCTAPLVALRWPRVAAGLAGIAVLAALVDPLSWSLAAFIALGAVAVVAIWRSPLISLLTLATAVSLLLGAAVLYRAALVPLGLDRYASPALGPSTGEVTTVVATYAIGMLVAVGVAYWARSSVKVAEREVAVATRSVQVEGEATLVGERARLARDLHDVVAHHISLIAVRAETAPYTATLQPEAKLVLADIATDARRALDELRGVLGILRRAEDGSPVRAPQPRLVDVATLVEAARDAGTDVRVDGELSVPVGPTHGYVAYRVVQEALTNARRHAPGQPVTVAVTADGPRLVVRVTNPGAATAGTTDRAGGGLLGMRERVEALGGTLIAELERDVFVVEADLPRGER